MTEQTQNSIVDKLEHLNTQHDEIFTHLKQLKVERDDAIMCLKRSQDSCRFWQKMYFFCMLTITALVGSIAWMIHEYMLK